LQLTRDLAATIPVVINLPTLPVAPIFFTATWQAGAYQTQLEANLWEIRRCGCGASADSGSSILSASILESPAADRLLVSSTLAYGFPYQNAHASGWPPLSLERSRTGSRGRV
jgi:hypothetical protein